MMRRVFGFLYGDIPVRFLSDFPLLESVERLRGRTKRTVFSTLFRQAAVGVVNESRVRLERVIPLFGNGFKPIFVGGFRHSQGRVVLEGRFTMFLFSKVFMTAWLTFALVWTAMATATVLHAIGQNRVNVPDDPMAPFVGLAFLLAGVGFVRGCWWLSRNDMAFLESVIQAALKSGASNSAMERTR